MEVLRGAEVLVGSCNSVGALHAPKTTAEAKTNATLKGCRIEAGSCKPQMKPEEPRQSLPFRKAARRIGFKQPVYLLRIDIHNADQLATTIGSGHNLNVAGRNPQEFRKEGD